MPQDGDFVLPFLIFSIFIIGKRVLYNSVSLFVVLLGLSEKLLLKPKAGGSLQTERVPRSSGETKHHFSAVLVTVWVLLNSTCDLQYN